MMLVVVVVVGYLPLLWLDSVRLFRKKNKTDFSINASLYLLSFVIALLLALGVELPSPSNSIRNGFEFLFRFHT